MYFPFIYLQSDLEGEGGGWASAEFRQTSSAWPGRSEPTSCRSWWTHAHEDPKIKSLVLVVSLFNLNLQLSNSTKVEIFLNFDFSFTVLETWMNNSYLITTITKFNLKKHIIIWINAYCRCPYLKLMGLDVLPECRDDDRSSLGVNTKQASQTRI